MVSEVNPKIYQKEMIKQSTKQYVDVFIIIMGHWNKCL
jgi:hypothetical protein